MFQETTRLLSQLYSLPSLSPNQGNIRECAEGLFQILSESFAIVAQTEILDHYYEDFELELEEAEEDEDAEEEGT